MDWKAGLRPAILVGAACQIVALLWMARSSPIQGDWAMGLRLLVTFLVPAAATWLIVMMKGASRNSR
ncbi:MAG: hypothetical protein OEN00_12055 [Gemmatimonadota bacterium]|nr:hypothetical protein [Gemmatimonadota bacterium]